MGAYIRHGGAVVTVGTRFNTLLENLKLKDNQCEDGMTKHGNVRRTLNLHYYNLDSRSANSMLVGSWGKNTEIRPPRDIDVLFVLPNEVYWRFEKATGNKQSQILQEVKGVLLRAYPNTDVRGDGPVVLVPFGTYAIELVPAFNQTDGRYKICITKNGGSYKTFDPVAEIAHVTASNDATGGNTRDLVRMLKRWQEYCNVPLKSFVLELLAVEFLQNWEHRGKSTTWYDYMSRDFFKVLSAKTAWSYVVVPGTGEILFFGDAWKTKAESARDRAVKACEFEASNQPCAAGTEWQKIYGDFIPMC